LTARQKSPTGLVHIEHEIWWIFVLEVIQPVEKVCRVIFIKGCSAFLVWSSQESALASLHILEKCGRCTEALEMAFSVSLWCIGIKAQVLQMRSCRTDRGLERVITKKMRDRSFAFWVERSDSGVFFGEWDLVLVCNLVAMPVTKVGLRDARISRKFRDGSALQIERTDAIEDIVNNLEACGISGFHVSI
jgi:hypothetical protein